MVIDATRSLTEEKENTQLTIPMHRSEGLCDSVVQLWQGDARPVLGSYAEFLLDEARCASNAFQHAACGLRRTSVTYASKAVGDCGLAVPTPCGLPFDPSCTGFVPLTTGNPSASTGTNTGGDGLSPPSSTQYVCAVSQCPHCGEAGGAF